jgi:YD repeat-containing protein
MKNYSGDYAGNFALTWQKMNAPCNVVPINCGQVLSGSISTAAELDVYTFTVSADDVVTIRVMKTSGTFGPNLELFNAAGSRIAGPSTQITMTLATAGTYNIMVKDGNTKATGDYLIYWQSVKNPCNVVADLPCGQAVTGSIGVSVDPPPWRVYTFTGAVNDVVTIRTGNLTGGNFTPNIELYSPTGSLVVSNYNKVDQTTLSAAGMYTILMRSYSGAYAGNFALTWQKMNAPCNAVPINCGQVLSGSISTAAELDVYTFTVSANDVVTIRVMKTSGAFGPNLELFNAAGSRIAGPSTQINTTLTAAGTYNIMVRDGNTKATGDYLIYWQSVKNPCNVVADLPCGQAVTGSIGVSVDPPPWRVYTFTGAVNDVVTIRTGDLTENNFTPNIELFSPTGSLLVSNYNQVDRTLTAAGTYTILMRNYNGAYAGNFALTWQKMNAPCNVVPINCGQVLSGSISTAAELDVYTFTVSANDVVTIRAMTTSGGLFPNLELFNAAGSRIAGPSTQITTTLATAGAYTILVRDHSTNDTGDYLITWQKFNTPCAPAINCGQTGVGSIGRTPDAPPWGFYSFTVSANDIITIRAIKTSGTLAPFLELYNSSGGLVTSAAGQINRTMAEGSYVLLLRDQTNANTGGYAVTWQRWNNPCALALNCGQVVSGSIGITADPPPWRYYSFTASANDIVTIRATKTSGTLTPYLEIYNSSGTQVGSGAGQKDITLTAAGTYTVVVRDQNSINTGDYVLTWLRVNDPYNAIPMGCGQVLSGSLSTPGKIDAYTILANSGDNVVLTLTKTSGGLDPSLELYNSSGTRVGYQYSASGNEVTITQTLSTEGTYTVFASDYGNDETGSYRLKFQKNNNSCTEVSLLAPNGGESIVARSTFTIRWSCTSPPGVTSQEIRLSTDGGLSFPTPVVTGLAGDVRTYDWNVPSDLSTNQGRIRVVVTDGSMVNVFDDSDSDFTAYQGVGRIYVYDELNRLFQIIYEDGRRVTYTYDSSGNRITLMNEE